jgi:hypothetical protein
MAKTCFGLLFFVLLMTGCQTQPMPALGGDWIETKMYFGLTRAGGEKIADADWHDFVDRTITPVFPDGLTILYGDGQYRGSDGAVHNEPTAILIVLHPASDDAKLNAIAREYDRQFGQESVLRTDAPAKTSFISAAK